MSKSVCVILRATEDNTFIVAATSEPYFCFEAATKEEALALAARAAKFYEQWVGKSEQETVH